jgi:hypothetical protein
MMAQVHTVFDCKHEREIDVEVDSDVVIPASARGLGKCPDCIGVGNIVPIAGVVPQAGGQTVVLDSILLMPV